MNVTPDDIREALTEAPSAETQERHLAAIHREAVDERLEYLEAGLNDRTIRLRGVEQDMFQITQQVEILTGQVRKLEESQQREDTEAHVALRRSILAALLAAVLDSWGFMSPDEMNDPEAAWQETRAEVYRRYGGPELGLWKNPPEPPSPETKALVKLFLQRRQEA